ncbi:hypothetical protein V1286_007630 [Bradyrhizobium algeriense]|uniref:Uncharacterized protein n=1 Tax=Bradyrhizobium algeriense TaxID=634784 RepID=A0ABU8BNG5_9BRAD
MKTINPKSQPPETKARALVRALAYMMADRYFDDRRRNWQARINLDAVDPYQRSKRPRK